jgi:hypothetical protein
MSSKNATNKVVVLVIVGIILAWVVGGFLGGFMGNIYFALVMIAVIFSGVFGQKALTRVGGIGVPFTIGIIIGTNSWGRWWQYLICYLIAIFIGNVLSNFRPNSKQERLEFDNELSYNLISKDDSFTAKFPKKPKFIEFGSTRMYRYDYQKSLSLNISIRDTVTPKTKKELWEELVSELSVRHNFAQLDYEKTELQGVPSITAVLQDEKENIFYETVLINNEKVYVIVLAVDEENGSLFNKFVDSFRFIKG